MPNTVHLHRVLTAPPEQVYRAFIEKDAISSWLPPFGFLCTVHELDAREGGKHRMSFRNFATGASHAFGGEYVELVPGKRLVYTDRFDDPGLPGEMTVTVMLTAVSVGSEVHIEQQGIPEAIPLESCYLGWQESLRKLAKLVETSIRSGRPSLSAASTQRTRHDQTSILPYRFEWRCEPSTGTTNKSTSGPLPLLIMSSADRRAGTKRLSGGRRCGFADAAR